MDISFLLATIGKSFRSLMLPAIIISAIAFGGATRDAFFVTGTMEILACILIIWVINDARFTSLSRSSWVIAGIFGSFVGVALLQLVPLPAGIWTSLPGRERIVEAFSLSDLPRTAMPMSLAPQNTVNTLIQLLPPAAVFLFTAKSRWRHISRVVDWAVPIIAALSVVLGLAQIMYPDTNYFFPHGQTVRGQSQGIMQVVNHNATLLLMSLPFLGVAVNRLLTRYELGDPDPGAVIMAILLLATIGTGIVAAGSVAGYVLAAPALFASAFIAKGRQSSGVFTALSLFAAIGLAGVCYLVATNPNVSGIGVTDLSDSPLSRINIYGNTLRAIEDHFPVGSGLGSFASLYPSYENGAEVTSAFIAHAHNEYLEIALELGLPGMIILVAGVIWTLVMSVSAWRATQTEGGRMRRAASVACIILLCHCIVDFPIRTEAIGCLFAYCLAILASAPGKRASQLERVDVPGMQHKYIEI